MTRQTLQNGYGIDTRAALMKLDPYLTDSIRASGSFYARFGSRVGGQIRRIVVRRVMQSSNQSITKATSAPNAGVERFSFYGPPPLLDGENAAGYDALLAAVSGEVKPQDIFEELWVRDIVDLTWQVLRLRRLIVKAMPGDAYGDTLTLQLKDAESIDRLVRSAECRRNAVLREIERRRETFGSRVRAAAREVEDAEYEVLEPSTDKRQNAA